MMHCMSDSNNSLLYLILRDERATHSQLHCSLFAAHAMHVVSPSLEFDSSMDGARLQAFAYRYKSISTVYSLLEIKHIII